MPPSNVISPADTPVVSSADAPEMPQRALRLQALDALRGLTIAFMILVNTSGDGAHTYHLLEHSAWNGCTIADVIMPCFLFMVGVSLVFSLGGKLRRGEPRGAIVRTALRRAAILFLLGLAVNGFPFFRLHTFRIYGVLQRIAFCFFVATVLYLWLRPKAIAWTVALIVIGYWVLLRWVPVPGFGMPGRDVPFMDYTGSWPAWLDRHIMPVRHLYRQDVYDPEGFLSTVSAVATTLIGVLTGFWLQHKTATAAEKTKRIAIAGVAFLGAGLLWSLWYPLNKRLWTGSFVLWNAGISLVALAVFLWWLDVWRRGTRPAYPLLVFGTNALAVYAFSEFLQSTLDTVKVHGSSLQRVLFHPLSVSIPNPYLAALAYAILYTAFCYLPVWFLYRRRIFLKV